MTFTATQEKINEMIKYGEELLLKNYWEDFNEYLESMIEKFFPDAHLDVINKMLEWAKYPTLPLITLKNLKELEISVCEKKFKASIETQIVSQSTLDIHNTTIAQIRCMIGFTGGSRWIQYTSNCDTVGFVRQHHETNGHHAENINSHAKFINIVQSVWIANLPLFNDQVSHVLNAEIHTYNESCMKKVNDLEDKYNSVISELNDLKKDHEQLKSQYHELQYSTMLNTHSLKLLQPANQTYDYEAIKARKKTLHVEFRRVSKLMKLL